MNPEDLIEAGLIRGSDLDGDPGGPGAAELGPYGRYVLLEELGRGGAAIVYRAMDPLLNRELALKRLRFGDLDLEMRFLREAELLARLSHEGIMPIFDFGHEGDSHFYTMPLARGLSLDRWIVEHKPDARETARIVRQAAEALAHAHERGVLHRDLKPANILVSAEGHALVADFGLGRINDPKAMAAERMTQSGEVMGTPSYMAPEFALGDLKSVDARCDVYGLGATLYEALTGRPPFIGRSSLEILKRVTTEEPVAPRRLAPGTPADLEIICLKSLEKDPARRYATSREFADDLGRFLAGEPIRARRASPWYRLRRFVGRRRAIVAVALAGLLIATGVGIKAAFREDEASVQRHTASNFLREAEVHRIALDDLLRERSEKDPEVMRQAALAMAEIDKALEAEPDSAEAYYQKGRIHSMMFEKVEARRRYDMAIKKGRVTRAHLERALLDCQDLVVLKADPGSAAAAGFEALRKSIRLDLDAVRALKADPADREFAEALLELSRFDAPGLQEAARKLDAYVVQNPDWRARYWKGIAEMELRQLQKAQESLELALNSRRRTKASAFILDRLGGICYYLRQFPESEKRFKEAVELNSRLALPKVNLAGLLMELERFDEAIRWSDEVIDADPESVQAHAIRAQCYVLKHEGQEHKRDAQLGMQWLKAAKHSLDVAGPAFPPSSPQAAFMQKYRDYVVRLLDY